MAIPLRKELVQALIQQRFGAIDDLVVAWAERVASGVQRRGRARDRASLYRWMKRGLPSNRDDILGFAGILDVDPIAILDVDDAFIDKFFAMERRRMLLGAESRSLLSPFWPIYTPGPAWPNDEIAHSYYARPWFVQDFAHDPAKVSNVYAAVHLHSTAGDAELAPRTYHFAYRRTGARDGMWRPYGVVIGYRHEVRLISDSGDYQRLSDDRSNRLVAVETYFGAGPAEFRIASLHDFTIEVEAPAREDVAVRFEA